MMDAIRIGIVGAGANTRLHHIPGFQALPNVEVVSVCNRTRESGERVAEEFGIPEVYDDWEELVEAEDTDAICIGTWPYLHCPVTLAALDEGKHVLTEARMAMNSDEAHEMLSASLASSQLVTQIVPAPMTLKFDRTILDLIAGGFLGEILSVDLLGNGGAFIDWDSPLHWRQERDLSGFNILNMGIWYETLMRWIGPAVNVQAMSTVNVRQRRNEERVAARLDGAGPRGSSVSDGLRGAGATSVQRGDGTRSAFAGVALRQRRNIATGHGVGQADGRSSQ